MFMIFLSSVVFCALIVCIFCVDCLCRCVCNIFPPDVGTENDCTCRDGKPIQSYNRRYQLLGPIKFEFPPLVSIPVFSTGAPLYPKITRVPVYTLAPVVLKIHYHAQFLVPKILAFNFIVLGDPLLSKKAFAELICKTSVQHCPTLLISKAFRKLPRKH